MLERGNRNSSGGEFTMRPEGKGMHGNRGSSLKKVINHKQGSSRMLRPLALLNTIVHVAIAHTSVVTLMCLHKRTKS